MRKAFGQAITKIKIIQVQNCIFVTREGDKVSVTHGSAMDIEITREVFNNFKKICSILGIKDELLQDIDERLENLVEIKIGSFGQLLEWQEEYTENELGHRHFSHLYGLFPSELFVNNQNIIEACKKSLDFRLEKGSGHTGWSCAWIINLYAILKDSKNVYKYLKQLLTKSTYDNLWDAHPPFQIDGNFGGAAAIANMLVQDKGGKVEILPGLPKEFKSGYVKGLRIKNNKTIDIDWENGEVKNYNIY